MIRVLIVDDSLVQQELLKHILSGDPEIDIIGTAADGEEAVKKALLLKPDVITMDIHMPKMNGIEATQKIMSTNPIPIVIISGTNSKHEIANTFQAIESGAVAVIDKINYVTNSNQEILRTVKSMAEVKLVTRRTLAKELSKTKTTAPLIEKFACDIIAIGTSTGGPLVLQEIFSHFPAQFPPVLVVQHISPGFLEGFAEWLSQTTGLTVIAAEKNMSLKNNHIYLAPDHFHMGIDQNRCITLDDSPPVSGHRPSASYLLRSVAKTVGPKTLGILLTGMGRDGAEGLKAIKDKGGYTIAQNEESCVIFGMPKEAIDIGAASVVLSPEKISDFIKTRIQFNN